MFSIDTNAYPTLLNEKASRLNALFSDIAHPDIQVFDSPPSHYRMRAEFRIWHDGDEWHYAMFEPGQKASSKTLVKLETLPIACEAICNLMPVLRQRLHENSLLTQRLFQIEFLATLSGDMLVTLIYHKKLDEAWEQLAQQLEDDLGIFVIGRSRKQKVVITQDYVTEVLTVHGKPFTYKQIEGGFTQPNAIVCQKMLEWACDCAKGSELDLLELYCGNGNFTLPLSQYFPNVLATEISKTSVHAALWNCEKNQIQNLKIARLSSEEFTQAYTGEREFRRLQKDNIALSDYQFGTIFVDPPRAGIDNDTLRQVQQFDTVIYISCNPDTLLRDMHTLNNTHAIERFALFDQFPYTDHIESGVLLKKR